MKQIHTAYHEAGHAVAEMFYGTLLRLITIEPTEDYSGITISDCFLSEMSALNTKRDILFNKKKDKHVNKAYLLPVPRNKLRNAAKSQIISYLAGYVDEKKYYPAADPSGSWYDFINAAEYAKSGYHFPRKYVIDGVEDILRFTFDRFIPQTEKFVDDHWDEILFVAKRLYRKKTLKNRDLYDLYHKFGYGVLVETAA